MSLTEVDRMFERYAVGEHVKAVRGIIDASTGREVVEGARGIVEDPCVRGVRALVRVYWGGWGDCSGFAMVTSADNLEPVHRAPNRGED
jgi:hypothetical protein